MPAPSWRRRLARVLLRGLAVALALTVLPVLALRWVPPPTSAFMLQRWAEAGRPAYRWVPWERLSPHLAVAAIAAEDQTFPHHRGFDLPALRRALAEDRARKRGASTITQQVAKNLFLWPGRSLARKALEAYFTVLLEAAWPKRRILEVYLNVAEFGDGVYGAAAAAERFFATTPDRLGPREASLLAAVLPNPKRLKAAAPSSYVQERSAWIQAQMGQLGGPGILRAMGR